MHTKNKTKKQTKIFIITYLIERYRFVADTDILPFDGYIAASSADSLTFNKQRQYKGVN